MGGRDQPKGEFPNEVFDEIAQEADGIHTFAGLKRIVLWLAQLVSEFRTYIAAYAHGQSYFLLLKITSHKCFGSLAT